MKLGVVVRNYLSRTKPSHVVQKRAEHPSFMWGGDFIKHRLRPINPIID